MIGYAVVDSLSELTWHNPVRQKQRAQSTTPTAPAPTGGQAEDPSDFFLSAEAPNLMPRELPARDESAPPDPLEMELPAGPALDEEELRQTRRDLKAELKELWRAPPSEQAGPYQQLQDVQGALERMQVEHREIQWDKAREGVDWEPSPSYRSFFVHGQTPIDEMSEVLRVGQSLEQPDSPLKLQGNRVDTLTREEIWERKMDLLQEAADRPVRDGKPLSIDAEYYELASPEMVDRMSRAARGGANVRVLMDAGHLGPDGSDFDATSMAVRAGTYRQLEAGSGGQIGVQLFANHENMGGRTEIMHRKQLRVGDTVVFGGMNANPGSGENVDFGMTLEGPAATELGRVFEDDLARSAGRDSQAIYGDQLELLRTDERQVSLRSHGLLGLLEAQAGQPVRPGQSREDRVDTALRHATYNGVKVSELTDLGDREAVRKFLVDGHGKATLTQEGRNLLADTLENTVEEINAPTNQGRLLREDLPSDAARGQDVVAVGDSPAERQALLLHAIDSADRSIKVSAFVMNEDIARLLADKQDRMQAEGKPFDVQVVLDPGIYGYGGTPNEAGYTMLEDRGVPVKWAVLDRSGPGHDRKVHAKMLVTDKMMLAGSTNFSHKGLRDNWELTDVVYFDESENSRAQRAEVEGDFDRLWTRESLDINTRELAEHKYADLPPGPERDLQVERERKTTLRTFLREIDNYEREIGERVHDTVRTDPTLSYDVYQRVADGQAHGYAVLGAVGDERLQALREDTDAWKRLQALRSSGEASR